MGNKTPSPAPTPSQEGNGKKYFDIIAGAFGIIGFFLAIYFYIDGKSERRFTYYVSESRTPIIQKGVFTNLSVALGGRTIEGDVSAVQIQLWNDGKEPIRHEDILSPITVMTAVPIYQVSIKSKRSEAQAFYTNSHGQLVIDWKILEEKKDGISLQLVYGGKIDSPFALSGSIVGQDKVFYFKLTKVNFWNAKSVPFLFYLLWSVLIAWYVIRTRKTLRWYLTVHVIVAASLVYWEGYLIAESYKHVIANNPPFGF